MKKNSLDKRKLKRAQRLFLTSPFFASLLFDTQVYFNIKQKQWFQKQPPEVFCKKVLSISQVSQETSTLEFLLNKAADPDEIFKNTYLE